MTTSNSAVTIEGIQITGDRGFDLFVGEEKFFQCIFEEVSFDHSLREKCFSDCRFNGCTFKGTDFWYFVFKDCTFMDCAFSKCYFKESQFIRVQFESCQLEEVRFFSGISTGLVNMEFKHCELSRNSFQLFAEKINFSTSILDRNSFCEAMMTGKIIPPIPVIPIPHLGQQILQAIRTQGEQSLDMEEWHSECGTAHCLAGWITVLHPQGRILEKIFSTPIAAQIIFPEAAELFFSDKERVLEFLETFTE